MSLNISEFLALEVERDQQFRAERLNSEQLGWKRAQQGFLRLWVQIPLTGKFCFNIFVHMCMLPIDKNTL